MNRGRICPALLLIGATCTGVVTAQAKAGYEIAVVQECDDPHARRHQAGSRYLQTRTKHPSHIVLPVIPARTGSGR